MRERELVQLSFADTVVSQLGGKRTQALLNQLNAAIDWESLAKPIRAVYRNTDGGSPAANPRQCTSPRPVACGPASSRLAAGGRG